MEEQKEEDNLNLDEEVSNKEKSEESSIKVPLCRICYEAEKENNILIHPCRCTGSVRYVHEECLKTWLLCSDQDLANRACELCHTTFSMKYEIVSYITCKELCDENVGICIFIPILLAILGLIIVIVYFLAIKFNSDTNKSDRIYALSLIIGCSFAGTIISFILLYIFKTILVRSRMADWKIQNQEFMDIREKPESDEHNLFTQAAENNVLILPKNAKICGKKIRSPKVVPMSLTPIVERSKVIGYRTDHKEIFAQSCVIKINSRANDSKVSSSHTYQVIPDRQNITL